MQLRNIHLTSVTLLLSQQEASKQNPIHSAAPALFVMPRAACEAGRRLHSPWPASHEAVPKNPPLLRPFPTQLAASTPKSHLEGRCRPALLGKAPGMAARGSTVAAPHRSAPRSSMPPLFSLSARKRGFCELSPAAALRRSPSAFLGRQSAAQLWPAAVWSRLFIFAFGQQL